MSLKKNVVCPNPLFLLWLEEWKNEAEKHGLNSKWTLVKAISSIKKYPLPLRSGKECKILENIGDGIAKRLDERLKQYLDDGGDAVYLHKVSKGSKSENNSKITNSKKCNNKVDPVVVESDNSSKDINCKYVCKYRSGPYALILSLFQESKSPSSNGHMTKNELQEKAQPLCDKSFTVPDPGSHYTAWSSMGTLTRKGYVVKRSSPAQYSITDSGCELAQRLLQGTHELSDETFNNIRHTVVSNTTQQDEENMNSNHSEKVSLEKDSVPEVGNLLARLRKNGYQLEKSSNSITSSATVTTTGSKGGIGMSDNNKENILITDIECTGITNKEEIVDILNPFGLITTSNTTNNISRYHTVLKDFNYHYVTDKDNLTLSKSTALVNIDEDLGLCFLIKVKKCDLDTSGKSFKLDKTHKPKDGFVYVYLADKDCVEMSQPAKLQSSGLSEYLGSDIGDAPLNCANERHSAMEGTSNNTIKNHTSKMKMSSNNSVSTKPVKIKTKNKDVEGTSFPVECSDTSTTITMTRVLTTSSTTSTFTSLKRASNSSIDEKEKKVSKLNPSSELEKQVSDDPSNLERNIPGNLGLDPLFTLSPGSFEIILCVDTTETSGTGKHKKDLAGKLYTSNIHVDTRKLQLGDFLWIAKERSGERRELVLDSIIERKRMDDLAGSIIDGRFHEQKFRLKSCALKNPIYLVEKYGSTEHLPVPEKTLRQAITNTQVIDNFFVKETADIYDSANYLTLITSQLSNLYSGKTLHATTMDKVKEIKMDKSHESLIQEDIQYLMTFEEFYEETQKNKVLTVSEMFAKQLMQIKGITTEKALAIIEKYPTPLSLLNTYDSLICQSDKEKLLTNITFGNGKRKVGDILSRQVYVLYSKLNVN